MNKRYIKQTCSVVAISLFVSSLSAVPLCHAKPKLNRTKITMLAGNTVRLKVKKYSRKVTWKSNRKKIAAVNKNGVVTAKTSGKAEICAKFKSSRLTCKVTVKKKNTTIATNTPNSDGTVTSTNTPAWTQQPSTSIVPGKTEPAYNPKITKAPDAAKEPVVTNAPDTTREPVITNAPDITRGPVKTEAPGTTAKPLITASPKPTVNPGSLAALPTADPGKDDGWIRGWY